jgi:NAD(P)-dependent dehydrogenase (short-subunit alcohol dehydrogenase family)
MIAADIFSVTGKVAFVTGAGSGLGRTMAQTIGDNGGKVACFDIDVDGLAETKALLEETGAEALTFAGSVTDATALEAAVAATVTKFGRLDIAIANAGISDPQPALLHETRDESWYRVVDINLNGVFITDRAALKQMMRQGSGKVINIASMWGLAGASGVFPRPAYSATKGAVVNLTRELGLQYALHGIQVNAICPGFFRTKGRPRDAETARRFEDFTPMGRIAEPHEIRGSVLYLASAASDFVTGTALVVDGGCMAK